MRSRERWKREGGEKRTKRERFHERENRALRVRREREREENEREEKERGRERGLRRE